MATDRDLFSEWNSIIGAAVKGVKQRRVQSGGGAFAAGTGISQLRAFDTEEDALAYRCRQA
jgi:hypothetical protein